ncbi:hypothetical protein JCM4914_60390 [Streptomyces platensis subsp. malvinus]
MDGGGSGAQERTVPRGAGVVREVGGGRPVPGQAAAEYVLGLQPDVLGVGGRPAPEAAEDVREVEAAALQERLRGEHRHLRVVGGLTALPAAARVHLAAPVGKPGGVRARLPELEGGAQGVSHG